MRIPLDWLKEYVELDMSAEDIADLLNMAGLEIEGISPYSGREGFADTVLDAYVTPNRGDWLSMVGVAREVAANTGQACAVPVPGGLERALPVETRYNVTIEAPDLCPRYVGLLVTGVKVGPSPAWLVNRIEAAGVRTINNVVDITNFVCLESGQPLHAFELGLLHGPGIIVRTARPGETLVSIDGKERELTRADLVIADADHPVALAGVMGGIESEVGGDTTNVLIESAHFSATSIRRTAGRHGLKTEASFRFERVVDPSGCLRAAWRAAELMEDLCGATVTCAAIDRYPRPYEPSVITLRPARCNALLGTDLSVKQMSDCLSRLQLPVDADAHIQVVVPSFRPDLQKEVDLIEEVARLHGYNAIPTRLPRTETVAGGRRAPQETADAVRETLMQCGLWECWTYSLVSADAFDRLGLPEDHPRRRAIAVSNPLSMDAIALRTTLAHSLLQVLEYNVRRRNLDLGLFEVGRVYLPSDEPDRADERLTVGILLTGSIYDSAWNAPAEVSRYDFHALKAMVEALLLRLCPGQWSLMRANGAPFKPGSCAAAMYDGAEVGRLGVVDADVLANYGASGDVMLAVIDVQPFVEAKPAAERYRPVPRFPDVARDMAFVVDSAVAAGQIREAIRAVGGEHLAEVALFDLYEGRQLPAGKKGLAFSLSFRSADATLTDEQVDAAVQRITEHLSSQWDATLRA